jgi:hypothetical protein
VTSQNLLADVSIDPAIQVATKKDIFSGNSAMLARTVVMVASTRGQRLSLWLRNQAPRRYQEVFK